MERLSLRSNFNLCSSTKERKLNKKLKKWISRSKDCNYFQFTINLFRFCVGKHPSAANDGQWRRKCESALFI